LYIFLHTPPPHPTKLFFFSSTLSLSTHSLFLSLSLSLTHTHTHTHTLLFSLVSNLFSFYIHTQTNKRLSRFIINCPREELNSLPRICFQVEAAHWFYEDFYREETPSLPAFSLKSFAKKCVLFFTFEVLSILHFFAFFHSLTSVVWCVCFSLPPFLFLSRPIVFNHCPLLQPFLNDFSVDEIYSKFSAYKTQVPVCGAILLTPDLKKVFVFLSFLSLSLTHTHTHTHCIGYRFC